MKRVSIYVVPDGELGELGQNWLGSDIRAGIQYPAAAPELLIRRPKRYGFHATLKAPFRPSDAYSFENIKETLDVIVARHKPFSVDLTLRQIGAFWALTPDKPSRALVALAADLVMGADRFRANPTSEELARRAPARLDRRGRALLAAWGYPYVLERFTPHLTLTGPVSENDASAVAARLEGHFSSAITEPWVIRSVALCVETDEGAFRVIHECYLSGVSRGTSPEDS